MGRNRDEEQFFKDLGATAEQTVEEVRGFEENYFSVIQSTMAALPWFAELNKNCRVTLRNTLLLVSNVLIS